MKKKRTLEPRSYWNHYFKVQFLAGAMLYTVMDHLNGNETINPRKAHNMNFQSFFCKKFESHIGREI